MTKPRSSSSTLPLLGGLLDRLVRAGHLTVIDPAGRAHRFGEASSGSRVVVRIRDRKLPIKLALAPSLALGEAYMDGRLTLEAGTVRDLLRLATSNLAALEAHPFQALRQKLARLRPRRCRPNPRERARANVTHHYDLSGALYDLFLDVDRQYSCAYFPTGTETLEEAQAAKKRHLAAKLLLRPGHRVLDIGSGWGGLALELASEAGARVKGVTLSREQLDASRARAEAAGLSDQVQFDLVDYRDVVGRFDRIVSVGMFEHVGPRHYDEFFSTVARVLDHKGVAVIHSIGRRSPPGGADPWISKYIFPGGHVPALSEVMAAVERSGLWATDIEILRLHYADTLRHWYDRFQRSRHQARALYGERFCRMWEFYLAASEIAFRHRDHMVFQLQLARKVDAVPLTRDYIGPAESAPKAKPRRVA